MAHHILIDDDIAQMLTMADAIRVVKQAMEAHARGALIAPPRFHLVTEGGSLVFTVGATPETQAMGFRVYNTIHRDSVDPAQLVALYDSQSGELKIVIIGSLIGAMRTGAIGGIAIQAMSRPEVEVLGLIGSGLQAQMQLEAAVAVRRFKIVKVYSRSAANRERFAAEMGTKLALSIEPVASAEEAVREADVLLCATYSVEPVFNADWLKAGIHINTIGSKYQGAIEIDPRVADLSGLIATDSIAQVKAFHRPFFLAGTPHMDRLVELSQIVAGRQPGRTSPEEISLFCSVGLAATEVVVAHEAFQRWQEGASSF